MGALVANWQVQSLSHGEEGSALKYAHFDFEKRWHLERIFVALQCKSLMGNYWGAVSSGIIYLVWLEQVYFNISVCTFITVYVHGGEVVLFAYYMYSHACLEEPRSNLALLVLFQYKYISLPRLNENNAIAL